jgi:hypothetical protein
MKSILYSIVILCFTAKLSAQNAPALPVIDPNPTRANGKNADVKNAKALQAKVKKEKQSKVIPNELLLSLTSEKILRDLLIKYSANSLSVKRKLSTANNYWLVTFDPATVSMSSILALLRKESGVVGVSSNSIVSTRE